MLRIRPIAALGVLAAAVLASPPARAGSASNQGSDDMLMGMATLTSDYMMRGISQTWGDPAPQAGGDAVLKNGFDAGFMASSVSRNYFPGADAELDLYASFGAKWSPEWSWRVGVYGFFYPGANLDRAKPPLPSRSFDTIEANASIAWKWLTLKYSRSLTDYMGIDVEQGYDGNSKGTQYLQLDAAIPLGAQWDLALHAAHLDIPAALTMPMANGQTDPSYSDFGATVRWQFHPHWSASLGVTHATNAAIYGHMMSLRNGSDMQDLGGTRGFVALQANF